MRITFELSEKCNAACPLCVRTDPYNQSKPIREVSRKRELLIKDFMHILPSHVMKDVEEISLCGNVGDPIAARDCLKIVQYISEFPHVQIIIETNGSLRSDKWWKLLGEAMKVNELSVVYFHVDGLKDTNHIYRQLTNFDKIMENAEAYISTGATAIWEFIPFAHNEHQVEEAHKKAMEMGFDKFIVRRSNRKWTKAGDTWMFSNAYSGFTTLGAPTQEKYLGDGIKAKKDFEDSINGN